MVVDISPLWIVIGLVLFVLGVRWTIRQAALRNYEQVKANLPVAKAAAKGTLWAAVRTAGLVLILLVALSWFDLRRNNVDTGNWLTQLRSQFSSSSSEEDDPDRNVICFSAECRRQHPEKP
jgi:hypothetical protein